MLSLSDADRDAILTLQLAVAFAGERAAEPGRAPARLSWWNTDMVDELGGHDLLERMLPLTWRWAALEAAREAARRTETARFKGSLRSPDSACSLFRLGFEVEEQLAERVLQHKRNGTDPAAALPGLAELLSDHPEDWSTAAFIAWLEGGDPPPAYIEAPAGRELQGPAPSSPRLRARRLTAALLPLPAQAWPCPHYRLDT